MKLQLLYFGIVRERLGRREESRELPGGATVGDLLDELASSHGIFTLGAGSIRIAVNREYVEKDHVLADGDEVAVIPPVAGGSSPPVAAASLPRDVAASSPPVAAASSPRDASTLVTSGFPSHVAAGCWPFHHARGQ
jgi:MoaE-MoaD fusion protein